MIHHVGIEVAPADIARAVELFELLGFEQVEPPPSLAEGFTWLEREGTQVHLMHEPHPVAPPRGHLAVVAPDFEATVARLRDHDFQVDPRHPHWRSPRATVTAPGGHRIELMQSPPKPHP
jgi:catechol 2,3-dioxygenase-like lactoylglutathione lyase family enzyme